MSERDPHHTRSGDIQEEMHDKPARQDSTEPEDEKKAGVVDAVLEAVLDIAAELIDAIT